MFGGELAVLVGGGSVLFGMFMLADRMMMSGLMAMMRGGVMMSGRLMMMLGRWMLYRPCHFYSLQKRLKAKLCVKLSLRLTD
jgi:hypothetical protein